MRTGSRLLVLALLASLAAPSLAWPCTTFLFRNGGKPYVGKSYDWDIGHGMVVINKRGVTKQGLVLSVTDRPVTWTSRHASVTFNQYGRELPNSGMNDAGLVVEVMWLDGTVYPPADGRPALNELQLVQYLLDGSATAAEAAKAAQGVRVVAAYGKLHYLACDAQGACVALEYLDGKLVVASGDGLPVPVLANSTVAESATYLAQHAGFGGRRAAATGTRSLDRYVRAATLAKQARRARDPLAAALGILDAVSQGEFSVWNLVYSPAERRVWFRTRKNGRLKRIDLGKLDLACAAPVRVLDIDADLEGDVTANLEVYTTEKNRRLVEASFASVAARVPAPARALLVRYPDATRCDAR